MKALLCVPAFILSLVLGLLTLFLFRGALPQETGAAWAILKADEEEDDRRIGSLLEEAGLDYHSESTEGFYIDDFGALKWLPLDRYRDALEPFDPRDDGYGETLRALFVSGGARRFFISLAGMAAPELLEGRIKRALGDTPYKLEILGSRRQAFRYFAAMALALAAVFALLRKSSRAWGRFVFRVPLLLAFAWAGFPGLLMAGCLAALGMLLSGPAGEFFPIRAYEPLRSRLSAYRDSFFRAGIFFLLYWVFAWTGGWGMMAPAAVGLAGFLLIEAMIPAAEWLLRRRARHIPFVPLRIIPGPAKIPAFQAPLAAFAAAAALALLAPGFSAPGPLSAPLSGPLAGAPVTGKLPTAADYERHMVFETSFSYRPLGAASDEEAEYFHYSLDSDGLINGETREERAFSSDFPPFPLERLTAFLVQYSQGVAGRAPEKPRNRFEDWILVLILAAACVPVRFLGWGAGKTKRASPVWGARIAA